MIPPLIEFGHKRVKIVVGNVDVGNGLLVTGFSMRRETVENLPVLLYLCVFVIVYSAYSKNNTGSNEYVKV